MKGFLHMFKDLYLTLYKHYSIFCFSLFISQQFILEFTSLYVVRNDPNYIFLQIVNKLSQYQNKQKTPMGKNVKSRGFSSGKFSQYF